MTLNERYVKMNLVHTHERLNEKVHWKVNNRSFREKPNGYSLEIEKYQKVNQKRLKN